MDTPRGRLRELLVAGLVDSFGLSLGWTLFNLLALAKGGLAAAGLYNAAMLLGVVLSAPAAAWLAGRLGGRALLTGTAVTEIVLRMGTMAALLLGWPGPVIAIGVVVMNVAAWTGFAGMRAEVAAVDDRPTAMTRYATCIAAVEACGVGLIALLPSGPDGFHSAIIIGVAVVYSASLLLTLISTRRARVPSTRRAQPSRHGAVLTPDRRRRPRPGMQLAMPVDSLAGGMLVMLFASGPTLLAVALAAELHGRVAVAGAAAAFTAGCLLAPTAVQLVARSRLPATLTWPLWGIGMLIGWIAAPWSVTGLLGAQFMSGLSMTAFEGAMDARVATEARPGEVTSGLAWSAASRALGGAGAVRLLPVLVTAPAIGLLSVGAAGVLAVGGVLVFAAITGMQALVGAPGRVPGRSG
jgi:hypothetical protein